MSTTVTATTSASASASASATASSNITIKLLTGDLMVVEVRSEETYQSLYRLIKEALPEEIRPESLSQMNLLLDGELVPMTSAPVLLSEEVYLLVLDAHRYRISLRATPYHAINMTVDEDDVYELFHIVVDKKSRQGTERSVYSAPLLYHTERKRYYDMDGIQMQWVDEHHDDEFGIQLPQEKVGYTRREFVNYLMSKMEHLYPSMAMARAMHTELMEEIICLEEHYPSWEDSLGYGEEEEEEQEQEEQEQEPHWA